MTMMIRNVKPGEWNHLQRLVDSRASVTHSEADLPHHCGEDRDYTERAKEAGEEDEEIETRFILEMVDEKKYVS